MATRTLNVLSLFSGIGGLDLGVKLARPDARTVCYVEREAYAAAALVARMADAALDSAPIHGNVCTFDPAPWRGVVDLVAGGFPCQDISVAGNGAGLDGERSGLWREMARIIRGVGPEYVFVENVRALVVRGIDRVLGDLAGLGFDAEWGVFSAASVGAPHRRERVFILARRVSDASSDELRHEQGWRERTRRRGAAEPRRGAAEPRDVGLVVDDARGARLEGRGHGGATGDAGGDVADAARNGRSEGWAKSARLVGGPDAAECGGSVADAHEHGLQGERRLRVLNGERAPLGHDADRYGGAPHPLWPPGPDDKAQWQGVIEARPELAPAIESVVRGLVDGMAPRVERLHAAGNGVVPLAAAHAWRALAARRGW